MRALTGLLGAMVLVAAPVAQAQDADFEAAMEVQRCIWACLANSPGAASAEYNACVAQMCDGGAGQAGGEPGSAPHVVAGSWTTGQGRDGRPYAAVTGPGVDGEAGIYVQCGGGRGSVALGGFDGGNADMGLAISGTTYSVPAGPSGYPEVGLTSTSPLYAALTSGSSVDVLSSDGRTVGSYPLRGSAAALAALGGGC